MATRPLGTGYDPNSGYPPDDSTSIPWDSDVDLSGQFGPGGFAPNPKLTGPATGRPPGVSLSGPGGVSDGLSARPAMPGDLASMSGPDVVPPENSTIPNMKSVGPFTGGSATDAIIRGAGRVLPRVLRGRIPLADIVSPTDELAPRSMDEAPAWSWPQGAGPGRSPSGPGITRGPVPVNAPIPTPFTQPQHPSTMRYPMWPTPPAPEPAAAPMPARPVTPTPATAYGYPTPPVRPAAAAPVAAGPAATQQQPNLGNYVPVYQPNIARTGNARGGRSGDSNAPMMGALDLSRLFQRPQQ